MPDTLPTLLLITGRPASGKSTLAQSLAAALRLPLLSRDQLKEAHLLATGSSPDDPAVARHIYDTFFDTIHLLITGRISLIAEAAFQHKLWAPKLEPLVPLARTRIIVCTLDPSLARSRHLSRAQSDPARSQFHPDPPFDIPYDPPHLPVPTLAVNTTTGYSPSLDTILSFARS